MSGKITIKVEPSEASRERDRCVKLAAIEAHYWGETIDERITLMAMGAMGAAANICGAILCERTPAQHEAECKARNESFSKSGGPMSDTVQKIQKEPFTTVPLDKL